MHMWNSHAKKESPTTVFAIGEKETIEQLTVAGKTVEVMICAKCGKIRTIKY